MIDIIFPDELRKGDVIIDSAGERRIVQHVFRPDWQGDTGTINILHPDAEGVYDLNKTIKIER